MTVRPRQPGPDCPVLEVREDVDGPDRRDGRSWRGVILFLLLLALFGLGR